MYHSSLIIPNLPLPLPQRSTPLIHDGSAKSYPVVVADASTLYYLFNFSNFEFSPTLRVPGSTPFCSVLSVIIFGRSLLHVSDKFCIWMYVWLRCPVCVPSQKLPRTRVFVPAVIPTLSTIHLNLQFPCCEWTIVW